MKTNKSAEQILEEVEAMREVFSNLQRLARQNRLDMKANGLLDDFWYGRLAARENCYKLTVEELDAILGRAAG